MDISDNIAHTSYATHADASDMKHAIVLKHATANTLHHHAAVGTAVPPITQPTTAVAHRDENAHQTVTLNVTTLDPQHHPTAVNTAIPAIHATTNPRIINLKQPTTGIAAIVVILATDAIPVIHSQPIAITATQPTDPHLHTIDPQPTRAGSHHLAAVPRISRIREKPKGFEPGVSFPSTPAPRRYPV